MGRASRGSTGGCEHGTRDNHRLLRNASNSSSGRYGAGGSGEGAMLPTAASLSFMSLCR